MTENKKSTTESNTLRIPSRNEFHRYYSGTLSIGDFSTLHPTGYEVGRVSQSIGWTISNSKNTRQSRKD